MSRPRILDTTRRQNSAIDARFLRRYNGADLAARSEPGGSLPDRAGSFLARGFWKEDGEADGDQVGDQHRSDDDADQFISALRDGGFSSTKISTTGGFLRQGNATILVGTEEANVPRVLDIIKRNCHTRTRYVTPLPPVMEPGEPYMAHPIEVEVGGAVIFVLDVGRLIRY